MAGEKKRAPVFRFTAKNKQTREVTELAVAWPSNESAPGCYPVSLAKDMTAKRVAEILSEGGREGSYFLDLRVNKPREEREDF